ncbi:MAG: site-specific integrase [Phycisphaerae bacterium]|nr:site-specific integrase [Phycisphaerae bacterium]
MSIRKIRNSWWVDFRANGTRHRIRSIENSQAGAKAYEAVLRSRLNKGEPLVPAPPKPPAPTFAEFSEEWFRTYVVTNNKPSSQVSRRRILRKHLLPFFGTTRIDAIDNGMIERFKTSKLGEGLAAKTVNVQLGVVSKCLRDAEDWGVLSAPPRIRWLRQPRPRFTFLTRDEADRLVDAMEPGRWQTMAVLAIHTGMRLGELLGLEWNDIDLGARQLVVRRSIVNGIVGTTKNYRERQLPLSVGAMTALLSYRRDHRLVFHRDDGTPLTYGTAGHAISQGWKRAGLRSIGWHALRHTFASWLVADGVPLPVVQALLGHSTIEMTMRYSHLAPSALRSAIQVLDEPLGGGTGGYRWAPGGQRESVLASPNTSFASPQTAISPVS